MNARSILRRLVGAALLVGLVAPIVVPAVSGSPVGGSARAGAPGTAASAPAAGASCCGEKPCCAAAHACGTGACPMAAAAVAPAPKGEAGLRLAAGCPGPAPATTPSDRDPMLAPLAAAPSVAASAMTAALPFDPVAPSRTDDPAVPPPRA